MAPTSRSSPSTSRRQPGPRDVRIDIAYCGVCHSDLHTVRSEWAGTLYPSVPGHELVLDTVGASHDLDAYTALLKRDGTLCLVGAPGQPHPSPGVFPLIMRRRSIAGSTIGGIPETQEMLDFCAEHGIVAEIELIRAAQIEETFARMLESDVKYRFVIDSSSLGG